LRCHPAEGSNRYRHISQKESRLIGETFWGMNPPLAEPAGKNSSARPGANRKIYGSLRSSQQEANVKTQEINNT
jgi:hypothetical protein